MMRRFLTALALLVFLAPAAALGAEERWYVVLLGDEKAGWMVEREDTDDEGNIVTSGELSLSISRGAMSIALSFSTGFVETPEHKPVSMSMSQNFGTMDQEKLWRFADNAVLEINSQAGQMTKRKVELPTVEWLTPGAVAELLEEKIEAGVETFTYTTIDPMTGVSPITVTHTLKGRTTVEVAGKTVPAIAWDIVQSSMSEAVTTQYVNDEGEPLRMSTALGAMSLDILATDREFALAPHGAPEIMASTLVAPNEPVKNAREARKGWYILSVTEGDLPELPDAGAQRVKKLPDGTVRVVVDTLNIPAAPVDDLEDRRYTESNGTLAADDPEIIAIKDQALATASTDPRDRAEALRRFVHGFISQKSLGVGFATASEVCRTRQGDCSEHAVLLAALLRADGIPSRTVTGLLFADEFLGQKNVFGYHMWTQALLQTPDGLRWVDLDATLGSAHPTDATHLAISVSSLADGDALNSMIPLTALLGRLQISVENVEY